jgi:hypothetical protein
MGSVVVLVKIYTITCSIKLFNTARSSSSTKQQAARSKQRSSWTTVVELSAPSVHDFSGFGSSNHLSCQVLTFACQNLQLNSAHVAFGTRLFISTGQNQTWLVSFYFFLLIASWRYVVGCSQHFGIVGNGQVAVAIDEGDTALIQVCATGCAAFIFIHLI